MDAWRTSSYSDGNGGQCVEVAADGGIMVRDTTNREDGTLAFTSEAWATFTRSLKE
jgi:hypothetical protein